MTLPKEQKEKKSPPAKQPDTAKKVEVQKTAPAAALPKTHEQIKTDTTEKLEHLIQEINSPKLDGLLKDMGNINYNEWPYLLRTGRAETAIKQMKECLRDFPGLNVLIEGLNKNKESDAYKEAYDYVQRIVDLLNARRLHIEQSAQKIEDIKEDRALSEIGGVLNKVVTNFKRGSGVEKVASLAAIGIGIYLLKEWYNTKSGKWIIRGGAGLLAVNILTRLATGKSALEHLGLWQTKEDIPREIRRLAEKTGIANEPQKLKALAKIGTNEIRDCFTAYKGNQPIDPGNLGIYDESLTGTDIFKIMDELVKKAGGGDKGKGLEEFEKRFIKSKHRWTFFEVAMTLFMKEGAEMFYESSPETQEKIKKDLSEIFSGEEYGEYRPEIENTKPPYAFIKGYPAMWNVENYEKPEYSFTIDKNPPVKFWPKQSPEQKRDAKIKLDQNIKEGIKARLSRISNLAGKEPIYIYGNWKLKDVQFKGEKLNLTIKFNRDNPEEMKIYRDDTGAFVKEFTAHSETLSDVDFEKSEWAGKISRNVAVFNGLDVKVTAVSEPKDKKYAGWKYIIGEICGVPFKMAVEEKTNYYNLYSPEKLFGETRFIDAKADIARSQVSAEIAKLKNIIHEVDESLWRLTVVYKGFAGSVRENFWTFSADAKLEELIYIYKNELKKSKNLNDAGKVWRDTVADYKNKLNGLYEKLLKDIMADKNFSDENFEDALSELDGVGYASEDLKGLMKGIRQSMSEVDYEGWDKSDLWALSSRIYGKAREAVNFFVAQFARKEKLSQSEIDYVKYLDGAVAKKLAEVKIKSKGLFKKSVNEENLPLGPNEWGIQKYDEWVSSYTSKKVEKEKKGPELSSKPREAVEEKELESVKMVMRKIIEEASNLAEEGGKSTHEIVNIMDKLMGKLPEQNLFNAKAKEIANLPTETDRNIALNNYRLEVMKAFGIKSFNI